MLAERGVLYPGKSKIVIQRMVARAALTDSLEGIPFEPKDGRMTIPFSRSLAEITRANVDYLKKLEAARSGDGTDLCHRDGPPAIDRGGLCQGREVQGRSCRPSRSIPTLPEGNEPDTSE